MAYILKELAGADKLRAMQLAPTPNLSKANAVGKYRSILQSENDSWSNAESSFADSTNEDDSSQEECLKVAEKHHRNKKQISKNSKSSKKSINLSISNSSSEKERKPKKKAVEVVVTCKHCKKYGKTQHPERFLVDQCMWNKNAVCFRYTSMGRKMGLEYVKGDKFEKVSKDKWPKHKAVKDEKYDNNDG